MTKSKSIVGIAVGVSSIVLIVAGLIAHRSVQLLADTSDEILRSKELELSLERLLSSLRDAETGQRGYIVTGSEAYLFPYDNALREIDGRLHTPEERMQARNGSTDELQTLRGLVLLKLDELARSIELYRSGQRDEAVALVRSNEGKSAMDAIRAIDAGKHTLTINLPDEPLEFEVDALRISQVLGNLLTNAAKYTSHPGLIRLTADREGDDVAIRVADNGIGIAPEDLPRIFDMFAQVKLTLDRKEGGLGIGLALSRALVELHGGTLEGRSEGLGKGSEFSVRLQLAPAESQIHT